MENKIHRFPTIKHKRLRDPHVVILGAGASKAAVPVDKNGIEVSLLAEIHTKLDLINEIRAYGYTGSIPNNFETFYSDLAESGIWSGLTNMLEGRIRDFFKSLKILDDVTIYDYLVLSLTEKDTIISFNWDPFLMQAYRRSIPVKNLPQLVFPHGNTGVGICKKCKMKGYADCLCPSCMSPLSDMKLLYPVKRKNYFDGSIIEEEWRLARDCLSKAAGITVFGYSAPESDVEAYTLLKESYNLSNVIAFAPFSIINLASAKEDQMRKWEDIFERRMILFHTDFRESILWRYPRVSLETIFDAVLQQHPRDEGKSFRDFDSLDQLHEFVRMITEFEMA